ncbi:MAG: HAMP domain-containing protein [Lachnospiraceae bacterium]|nr:HAMP domain-containing protein [Lachnospiraceae bacterium]
MYIQNGVLAIISRVKARLKKLTSMRNHVFLALLLGGIVPVLILTKILQSTYIEESVNEKIAEIQSYGNKVATQMIYTGYLTTPSMTDVNIELALAASFYEGRIIVVDGNLKIIADTYEREVGKTLISEEVLKCFKGNSSVITDRKQQSGSISIPIIQSESKNVAGAILISFSLKEQYQILERLEQKSGIIMIFIATVLVLIAFIYSKKLIKPLKEITQSLKHVTDGYMDDEVSIKGYYELEQISDSFNEMLARMKTIEESRQEFVSNVSHELKTPITSIKVLADSLLMQEDAPVELYREFMTDITDEIERENKIITDLLSLVKLDKKSGEMHIASTNINELLEVILKRLKPIAMKRNIELVFESFREVTAEVDEVKLSLAISNLIENAIKYNVDDGWVRVSLNADHKYFYVKVADSGIGIPEAAQNYIFDRFYRVDKARSRQTGGTGLGLSITKNAILMHKGAIKVSSVENEGSTFTIRVPLSFIA